MRKFLFFLLLIPFFASLGHDAYIYYQEPEKGIRLSDIGALWDKYHKESHDQWKNRIRNIEDGLDTIDEFKKDFSDMREEISKTIAQQTNSVALEDEKLEDFEQQESNPAEIEPVKAPFEEGFTMHKGRDGAERFTPISKEEPREESEHKLEKFVGFVLEQKAVFVSGAIPLVIFILHLFLSTIARAKEEKSQIKGIKKKKRKGGGYTYSRK